MLSEYKKKGLLVVGTKQTLKALNEDKLGEIFIAQDAETYALRGIEDAITDKNIKVTVVESMKKLGKDCGISVGAATAGVLKTNELNN